MRDSIITHILNDHTTSIVSDSLKKSDIIELRIDEFEEFFHAIIHVNPVALIVEIDDVNSPYIKIIRIVKKSNLTKNIPILVISSTADDDLLEVIASLDIEALVYPPLNDLVIDFYIKRVRNLHDFINQYEDNSEINTLQSVIISGLASLAEYRDPETGEHIKRTQNYVKALATTLAKKGIYKDELTPKNIELIYISVPLHDIGKVGIRDEILLKKGRLNKEEFENIKNHTTLGYEAIGNVGLKMKKSAFLQYAADVAYTHHEKYDGSGYPRGLKGQEIPLIGRLMAIADVYDALISKRIYKEPMTHEEAVDIILSGRGTHFDPVLVDCFLELESTFSNISQIYRDADKESDDKALMADLRKDDLLNTILLVEDSKMVRSILKNQLEALGFDVTTAVDGLDGYQKAYAKHYDLILLDIEMPNMNGYEMAEKLLEEGKKENIIAITAAHYNITLKELRSFGIHSLLLKPIDLNRLATKYKNLISPM